MASTEYYCTLSPVSIHGSGKQLLQFHLLPRLVRVIFCNCLCSLFRPGSQVLLVNNTLLVYHEGHYSCHPVLRRVCQQTKAGGHLAVDHIIHFTTRGIAALTFQDIEIIPVVWDPLLARFPGSVSLFRGTGNQRPQGTLLLSRRCFPVQAILFALMAPESLSVL